jgi:hypothetical protein
MKVGTKPIGSTTTSKVTNAETRKLKAIGAIQHCPL